MNKNSSGAVELRNRRLLTPKQVARAIGVSEASLKRWCDKGLIAADKTAGGHRRLSVDAVCQFLRATGRRAVRPELLALPASTGLGDGSIERALERVRTALETGDEEQARGLVLDLYLAGNTFAEICDRVLARAFHVIGDRWEHGALEVYQERRACEICLRVLHEMRAMLPPPASDAPYAMGAALEHDLYALPNAMIELVLWENGWRAESYGSHNPAVSMRSAVTIRKPTLLWLSVSAIDSRDEFLRAYDALFEGARHAGCALVLGGRALTDELRREMKFTAYCDNLQHLAEFVRAFHPRDATSAGNGNGRGDPPDAYADAH